MQPHGSDVRSSWRSSTSLLISTAALGLFTGSKTPQRSNDHTVQETDPKTFPFAETFLYGFIVPIVPYMFEVRLGQDPAHTQGYISALLAILGGIAIPAAPAIGHFADRSPGHRTPLLISLAGCVLGTILVAATWSGEPSSFRLIIVLIRGPTNKLQYGPSLSDVSSKALHRLALGSSLSPCWWTTSTKTTTAKF